jgi:hypothetical protein
MSDDWSLKDKHNRFDKDWYWKQCFPLTEISKWNYIKDRIEPYYKDDERPQPNKDILIERLKFYWKEDIETLRKKLIEDIDNMQCFDDLVSREDIYKFINKRFGVDNE